MKCPDARIWEKTTKRSRICLESASPGCPLDDESMIQRPSAAPSNFALCSAFTLIELLVVVANRSVLRTRTYQLDALLNYWYVGGIPPWYPDPWERRKFSELVNPQPTEVMTFIDSHPTTGDSADFAQSYRETTGQDAWGSL